MSEDFVLNGKYYAVDLSADPPAVFRWNSMTWSWVRARITKERKRQIIARYEARRAFSPAWPKLTR